MDYMIGVDIGGTKCAVVAAKANAAPEEDFIIRKIKFPTNPLNPAESLQDIDNAIDQILSELPLENGNSLVGIGISCGSPLDSKRGLIQAPPNLPGWVDVPIVQMLRERYNCPVVLENDANACAVAEWKFGAGRGTRNMVFLTFGTGMGAGLILDGRLYRGASDMAGEIGHISVAEYGPVGYGRAGSFEGFCSGGGIAQLACIKLTEALQRGKLPAWCPTSQDFASVTAKTVAEAAAAGDPLAIEIYAESGRMLGRGLSILIDLLNPEAIVIGSVFQRSTDLLLPYAEKEMEARCLVPSYHRCRILPATLGNSIGDYAAISLVSDLCREA